MRVVSVMKKSVRTMITLYLLSNGSTRVSLKSIPSVKYRIRVRCLSLTSSNLIV